MRRIAIIMMLSTLCVAAVGQGRMSVEQYIEKYRHLALMDQEVYGIPASIKMAQGLLESDSGNSRLAVEGNNHFGIKCKSTWEGATISHDDDAPGECFRRYPSAEESFRDHSVFLDGSPRYQQLFELPITDYKGWARGLRDAGYATNPRYADLLIKVIEDNRLYALDTEVYQGVPVVTGFVERTGPARVAVQERTEQAKIDVDNYVVSVNSLDGYPLYRNNGTEFVVARGGDTFEKLAGITGVSVARLRRFNDAAASAQPSDGEAVYVRAKANRANNGRLMHVAARGESLRAISQQYGIKLRSLARLNRRQADAVFNGGEQVRLM